MLSGAVVAAAIAIQQPSMLTGPGRAPEATSGTTTYTLPAATPGGPYLFRVEVQP